MILKKMDLKSFSTYSQNKKIACYGIGKDFNRMIRNYVDYDWKNRIEYLVDGCKDKVGQQVNLNGKRINIKSLEQFLQEDVLDVVILVTCTAYMEIVETLNKIRKLDKIECFLFHVMIGLSENWEIQVRQTHNQMIPPVIHYCWFGGKTLPDLYKRCIDSWRKFCPTYDIKEWNESNCDINETRFTEKAYKAGKYGFVPDYFRLKIIYENGGIYLDTDVELIKNLDDLRYNVAFCGLQFPGEVNFGLGFGATKGNRIIKYLMSRYKTMEFNQNKGDDDEIVSPICQTADLKRLGMKDGPQFQTVSDMTIYPMEVLSPKNLVTGEVNITQNSYSIHHFDGSWLDGTQMDTKNKREENVSKIYDMFN